MPNAKAKTKQPSGATNAPTPDPAVVRLRAWHWAGIAVIIAVGLAIYLPSLPYPMIYDDLSTIDANHTIRNLWSFDTLKPDADTPVAGRPVVNLTFAINYAIGGVQPHGYRLVNIAIHLLNALLLLAIVRRSLLLPTLDPRWREASWGFGFAAALLWTTHPLNTEAVVYVTQRTELLAAFFWLLTMWAVLRGWTSPAARGRWFALAVAACALGMLSKEIAVGLPLMVLLYDRAMISGSFAAALRKHRHLYGGLSVTWLILIAILLSGPRAASVGFDQDVSPLAYLLTQSQVLVNYLWHVFWPAGLNIAYNWPIVTDPSDALLSMAVMTALFAAACWALWRRSALGMLAAVFFLVLGPSSSFVPIITEVAADRRMYLPLAAILVLLVVAIYHLAGYPKLTRWHAAALLAIAAVSTSAAILRVHDYRTQIAIWSDAAAKAPDSAHAHMGLGGSYLALREQLDAARKLGHESEQYRRALRDFEREHPGLRVEHLNDLAMTHYQRAIELEPTLEGKVAVANLLVQTGQYEAALAYLLAILETDHAGAQEKLAEGHRAREQFAPTHALLARVYTELGQLERAEQHYREAIDLNPYNGTTRNNFGTLLLRMKRYNEADEQFQQAARLSPHDAAGFFMNLGITQLDSQQFAEAQATFEQVLKLNPNSARAHFQLGVTLSKRNDMEGAARHYRQAIALDENHAEAHNNLGTVLARAGNIQEALVHFEKAVAINPDYADALRNADKARSMVGSPRR